MSTFDATFDRLGRIMSLGPISKDFRMRHRIGPSSSIKACLDRVAFRKPRPLVGVKRSYFKTVYFLSGLRSTAARQNLRHLVGELHSLVKKVFSLKPFRGAIVLWITSCLFGFAISKNPVDSLLSNPHGRLCVCGQILQPVSFKGIPGVLH